MRKIILIMLVFVAVGIIFIYGKKKEDPAQFNKILNEMVQAANAKNTKIFMDFFSLNYKGPSGITYPVVKRVVKSNFDKYDGFDVAYEEVSVTFDKNSEGEKIAKVDLELIVTGVKNDTLSKELIGNSGHFKFLTVHFQESTFGFWKIHRIEGLDEPLY